MSALPPATLEGWYALHQAFSIDWSAWRALPREERQAALEEVRELMAPGAEAGWSAAFRLVGGGAELFLVHFRASLEELAEVQTRQRRARIGSLLRREYDFVSVTEAGLYYATAQVAAEAEPGSREYHARLQQRAEEELATAHVRSRLYPEVPEGMDYLSFYPMNKRRLLDDNWYVLPVDQRSRLMRDHGLTGRRYAGKIFQVITGAVGLDDWEWGVTLFARDPLEFKRIVTEMRYDEASSRYGEFGRFFTGIRLRADEWAQLLPPE